jgi:hypothetical protein
MQKNHRFNNIFRRENILFLEDFKRNGDFYAKADLRFFDCVFMLWDRFVWRDALCLGNAF